MSSYGLSFYLVTALLAFGCSCIFALRSVIKNRNISRAYKSLCIGVVVSAIFYFIPYYEAFFEGSAREFASVLKVFFLSVHHAIRLFIVDVSFDDIHSFASSFGTAGALYSFYGVILFVVAPFLTFGFVLSFARDFTAYMHIRLDSKKQVFVFSELSLKAYYLARDVRRTLPKACVYFAMEDEETADENLKNQAKEIKAVLLSVSVTRLNELLSPLKRNVKYFLVSDNEEENVENMLEMVRVPARQDRDIYVRAHKDNRILDNPPKSPNTSVFRIEHIRSLIWDMLERSGERLFERAVTDETGEKAISVLVVGMGAYGFELVKALTWYTQIEGYRTSITVIDKDSSARDRFHHACPGYFDGSADSHCTIEIFSKMHTASPEFDRLIKEHKDIGYVFVALGNDSLNVNVAYDLRSRFAYMDKHPVIQTVVRNKQVSDALSAGQTYNGQRYDVEFIGSFEELYSYKMILDLEAKERIFKENLKWVDENKARSLISDSEEAFRRSRANDIFTKLLLKLCIPKGEIAERSRHRSWVNLMFSEGYRHGKYRDQIAKTHAGLVDYEDLPPPFAPKE